VAAGVGVREHGTIPDDLCPENGYPGGSANSQCRRRLSSPTHFSILQWARDVPRVRLPVAGLLLQCTRNMLGVPLGIGSYQHRQGASARGTGKQEGGQDGQAAARNAVAGKTQARLCREVRRLVAADADDETTPREMLCRAVWRLRHGHIPLLCAESWQPIQL